MNQQQQFSGILKKTQYETSLMVHSFGFSIFDINQTLQRIQNIQSDKSENHQYNKPNILLDKILGPQYNDKLVQIQRQKKIRKQLTNINNNLMLIQYECNSALQLLKQNKTKELNKIQQTNQSTNLIDHCAKNYPQNQTDLKIKNLSSNNQFDFDQNSSYSTILSATRKDSNEAQQQSEKEYKLENDQYNSTSSSMMSLDFQMVNNFKDKKTRDKICGSCKLNFSTNVIAINFRLLRLNRKGHKIYSQNCIICEGQQRPLLNKDRKQIQILTVQNNIQHNQPNQYTYAAKTCRKCHIEYSGDIKKQNFRQYNKNTSLSKTKYHKNCISCEDKRDNYLNSRYFKIKLQQTECENQKNKNKAKELRDDELSSTSSSASSIIQSLNKDKIIQRSLLSSLSSDNMKPSQNDEMCHICKTSYQKTEEHFEGLLQSSMNNGELQSQRHQCKQCNLIYTKNKGNSWIIVSQILNNRNNRK